MQDKSATNSVVKPFPFAANSTFQNHTPKAGLWSRKYLHFSFMIHLPCSLGSLSLPVCGVWLLVSLVLSLGLIYLPQRIGEVPWQLPICVSHNQGLLPAPLIRLQALSFCRVPAYASFLVPLSVPWYTGHWHPLCSSSCSVSFFPSISLLLSL